MESPGTPSRRLEDYFEVTLTQLRPGTVATFDLYLHFRSNNHILLWRQRGETLTAELLDRYREKGLKTVWVHTSDHEVFEAYQNAPIEPILKSDSKQSEATSFPTEFPQIEGGFPRTKEGALLGTILSSRLVPHDQKMMMAGEASRTILARIGGADSVAEQSKIQKEVRKTVQDVLDKVADKACSIVNELWKFANIDPEFEHGANVSTYSVVFLMAFGRVEPDLIADIALAGLLHDVGLSQVPSRTSALSWKSMGSSDYAHYSRHVEQGNQLLRRYVQQYGEKIPERVLDLIEQHHEKFDGTGYPKGIHGFHLDDIAQLLAMADLVESVSSGRWDGEKYTLSETFQLISSFEKIRNFPEYFNPEVFAAIQRWMQAYADLSKMDQAAETVGLQAKRFIQG